MTTTNTTAVRLGLMLFMIAAIGCGRSGPSYDEALQTFNTELQLYDNLISQREEQVASFGASVDRIRSLADDAVDRARDNPGLELLQDRPEDLKAALDDIERSVEAIRQNATDTIAELRPSHEETMALINEAIAKQELALEKAREALREADAKR